MELSWGDISAKPPKKMERVGHESWETATFILHDFVLYVFVVSFGFPAGKHMEYGPSVKSKGGKSRYNTAFVFSICCIDIIDIPQIGCIFK